MRIGVVVDRFDPGKGGAERALADLVRAATDSDHEVLVFAMSTARDAPGRLVRVALGPMPRGARDALFAKRAVRMAREARCDVVLGVRHVTGVDVYWPHGGVHAQTLAAVERSKGRVAGAVSRVLHSASPKQRTLLALERRFFGDPRGARIWCVSDLVRREILARWPDCAPLVEVHPNGVDLDAYHPGLRELHRARVIAELGLAPDAPVLVFLGGAWRLKGWPVLLAALARVADRPWSLVAAGDRHAAAGRAAARAGLASRVRVLPHRDARRLLGAADLLVQPTWRDPCPLATLEALASGVPVVTTDVNGAAEAFSALPDAGETVACGDFAALAEAISRRTVRMADPDAAGAARRAARAAAKCRPRASWLSGLVRSLCAAATSAP